MTDGLVVGALGEEERGLGGVSPPEVGTAAAQPRRSATGNMNTVCEVCGHIGFKRLLVCCRDCECSAAHQYCLDKVVFDASLADWLCYECLQRHGEVTCSRSLERVSSERSPSHAHFGSTVHQPITKRVESARDALPWGNKHAHQNKYWEVASLRNSKDKSEAHGDNNSNVIDGLTLEREKEEVIFQLDYRARNELPQRRMAAHVPQSSTLQNDAVAGIKNTPSVLERSVDSVDISSICQHDTTESSESSERFAECQKGTSCHRRKTVKMATTSSSSEESGEDIPSENKYLESNNLQASAEADYVLSRKSFLSEAQKERVVAFIQETQPGITVFVAVMRTSNVQPPGPSLIVPNRFLKHFAGKLSGTIKLQSPNGSVFDVKVTERYNKIVLRNGWKAFVYAHHIEESDSLLFRHIEKSCFEVLIFDSDGCEKVFSCSGIKSTLNFQERSVDSVDISSSSHYETTESSESERFARCHKGSSCHRGNTAKMAAISSSSEEPEDTPSENESFESDDLHAPPRADYVLSHRSYLSEAQNERVIALIQEIEPEITVFVAIMRKSHVQPPSAFLAISTEYAFAHFPHESTNVTLQRPGKSKKWHPKFYKRKEISVYMLRGQWIDFVRDNHVQEGDICLLLPTKGGRKFTFTVHLLRAATAHSRGGTGFRNVSSCHGRLTTKMASAVHIKEEPTDGEHVSLESDVHGLSHGSLENKDSGGPFEPPYVISRKSCLSQTQKKIIEEKVRAIQCEVPIYVAILNKSSVTRSCELELSARYAGANLPDRSQSVVLHWMGKAWKTQMVIRNGSRWFLCGGWSKFVCDNGLRVGDICLFELKKNERKLTMMVHIIFS